MACRVAGSCNLKMQRLDLQDSVGPDSTHRWRCHWRVRKTVAESLDC